MLTSARSNGCLFIKSSESGSRPSATEIFFDRRPNFPLGDCRSCSSTSFKFTLRIGSRLQLLELFCTTENKLCLVSGAKIQHRDINSGVPKVHHRVNLVDESHYLVGLERAYVIGTEYSSLAQAFNGVFYRVLFESNIGTKRFI